MKTAVDCLKTLAQYTEGYDPTGPGERMIDWTNGCIAVTNADMDEIWARVPDGTRVEIRP
jgi:hypothetical protein